MKRRRRRFDDPAPSRGKSASPARLAPAGRAPYLAAVASERPRLAPNLQVASNRDVVHVDRAGRVRSPLRYRAIHVAYYGLLAALVLAEIALVARLFRDNGTMGAGMGAFVALGLTWIAWAISRQFALRRAQRALAADRVAEAERIYRGVLRAPLLPPKYKTFAEQGLGACDAVAGRHEEALARVQKVLRRHGRAQSLQARLARYSEVYLLVNVGKLDEARAKLEALGPVPDGEYLRISHWGAELYLALANGSHALDDDELHRRADAALAITSAAPLLGMLAWAFAHRGDGEMAALLLNEARDRHPGQKLSGSLPLLEAWMEQQAIGPSPLEGDEEEEELALQEAAASRRALRSAR